MNTRVFRITAKTNLHVGNENGGEFSIIDKTIQRDPLTDLPCINSSSLKGAIKQYCVYKNKELPKDQLIPVKDLFGSDVDAKGKPLPDSQKGNAIFFDAKLLYLPQQHKDDLYHYVTTDDVVKSMNARVRLFDADFNYAIENTINGKRVQIIVDEMDKEGKLVSAAGELNTICNNENLPIIARNYLENGESKNLWYEQVLPAETVLYTIILEKGKDLKEALDGRIVQIGAGATIGYGYCQFELINPKEA